jgi:hypothetical protein
LLWDAVTRLDDTVSDEDLRTVEAALALLGVDLQAVVSERMARLKRVQPFFLRLHLDIFQAGIPHPTRRYRRLVVAILAAAQLSPVDVFRPIADAIPAAGKRRSRLHALRRHVEAQSHGLRRDAIVRFVREVESKVALLARFDAVAKRLGLRTLRTSRKRLAFESVPVWRLVDVFRDAGYSDYRAFRETAKFLRAWDPVGYPALTAEQVRSRWRARPAGSTQ